jgi:formylglycine-generating enzyme required for sulfatase activity
LLLAGICIACNTPVRYEGPPQADYAEPLHDSAISHQMVWIQDGGFWIGRTEVTWDEYLTYATFDGEPLVGPDLDAVSRPSKPLDQVPFDRDWGKGSRPAVGMSWNAARRYCEWLSLVSGNNYRLPTEDEWELACGSGGRGPLGERAWVEENSSFRTQPVGGKRPNEHGLHDMLGNLWEYCHNPWHPDEPERAVLRGGSWSDPGSEVSPGSRLRFNDDWTLMDPNVPAGVWWVPDGEHLGFRVMRPGPDTGATP